ncbi:NitT/TauT family transport system substrate-binding protein [Enterococcus sp. AZ091]|uniref:ABC transporter substrate-binding protein n=1 Tax=Enterococcus sp. AZ091 TaxID=2774720 RepID=UPI003F210642
MKKNLLIIFWGLCLLFSLSSCKNKEVSIEHTSTGLAKVSIQIDGAATPYYAPLYLAKEKGWFEEEGLDVEFYYASASEIVKNVAANNVEFGFPNSDPVVIGRSNGVPVKIIHTTYQEGLGSIIYKKNSTIRKPEDLQGKTIGITSYGSPNFIQLQVILEQVGLSLDDVSIKIIGTGAIVNSLVSDQVDAISFSMLRAYDLQEQGLTVGEFRSENYMPTQGNVVITSDKFLKKNLDLCQKFVKALNRSLAFLVDGHLSTGIETAIADYAPSAKGSEKKIKKVMENEFVPKLWQSKNTFSYGFGYSDISRYNNYIDLLCEYNLISDKYDAKQLVVNLDEGEKK